MKQIRPALTDQQREALIREIATQGWTDRQLNDRAKSVTVRQTYGTIAFEHWVADQVCLRSEAEYLAEEIVEKRKIEFLDAQAKEGKWPGVEAARIAATQGWMTVQQEIEQEIHELRDQHEKEYRTRTRQLRAAFFILPDQAKIDLWQKAVAKGIVEDGDPHAMAVLPLLVAKMMPEFEQAIKANTK